MRKASIASLAALCGVATAATAQTSVSSNITSDTTWGGSNNPGPIILEGTTFVKSNATLTILPGTVVRGQPREGDGTSGAPGSLTVTQDGRIVADGTENNPIIFTTAAVDNDGNNIPDDDNGDGFLDQWTSGDTFYDADPANNPLPPFADGPIPGATGNDPRANVELWGGLLVLGNAPTNLGTGGNSTAKVGNVEGLPASADTRYGGNIPNDDSGVLRFISVRHGGEVLGSANEINGVTFAGVGFGTTVEFCEVYLNWDDGFEWFGGTVNTNHLMVTHSMDDSFDGDQGWTGQNQFMFAVQPYFAGGSSGGDEAFEFDGDDSDRNTDLSGTLSPFPGYTMANFTVVGPEGATDTTGTKGDANGNQAEGRLLLRNNFSGEMLNGFIVNAPSHATDVFSIPTPNPVTLDNITVSDGTVPSFGSNVTANNITTGQSAGLVAEDQAAQGGLDPRPDVQFGTPGVTSSLELGAQFEDVGFRGAFDPDANVLWTTGWTALNAAGILVD